MSNLWWRFCQFYWPSQNIRTLTQNYAKSRTIMSLWPSFFCFTVNKLQTAFLKYKAHIVSIQQILECENRDVKQFWLCSYRSYSFILPKIKWMNLWFFAVTTLHGKEKTKFVRSFFGRIWPICFSLWFYLTFNRDLCREDFHSSFRDNFLLRGDFIQKLGCGRRYTYRVLQTIQIELILSCVRAELTVLGRAKTALKFKYEI